MNLLTAPWIPIQDKGIYEKITLQQLLCGEKEGEICLPRDDMELACLQLLSAITQTLFTPENKKALGKYVTQPLTPAIYQAAIQDKLDWFDLDHPETPFMQFRGVVPSKTEPFTKMEKLLAGVADGANKVFVNQQDLGARLCGGCTAVAFFNMANNAPSVGGGFQGGFRGNTPITIMVKGNTIRESLWLNVLTEENIEKIMPWYQETKTQMPNFVEKDEPGMAFHSSSIGFIRGLLWQPAHYELNPSVKGVCSCCGATGRVYEEFKKEKFKYTMQDNWPHPLSPTKYKINKDDSKFEIKFDSFTTRSPAWTHLSSFLYLINNKNDGSSPAPIVDQIKTIIKGDKLNIIVGGYRYKPPQTATIIERRHDLLSIAQGWDGNKKVVRQIISTAFDYKKILRSSLFSFISQAIINAGSKKNKDRIGEICSLSESNYYQQTESFIHYVLSTVNFINPDNDLELLRAKLKKIVNNLFDQATAPYRQEPKMLKALAMARRSLHKSLKDLEPQGEENE